MNLVELNTQEVQVFDGGWVWIVIGLVATGVIADCEDFKKGIYGN